MAFLIGGANSAADTGFNIENSVRMEGTQYMTETLGTPTSDKIFTWSGWFKGINSESGDEYLFAVTDDVDSYTRHVHVRRDGDKQLQCQYYVDSSQIGHIETNALFRDPNAWYHLVFRFDTTQAVANNRIRMYVNGSEISYKTQTMPDQNETLPVSGSRYATASYAGVTHGIDGYLADVAYIDGTSYGPDTFGETDEDSGIWKPIDFKDDVTFGDNGFFLEFKQNGSGTDASGIFADTSGEDNHLAVTGHETDMQTTDTPTNNWAILNHLMGGRGSTLSEGNLKVTGESDNNYDVATFGSDMKWYMEWKVDENYDGSGGGIRLGAIHEDELATNDNFSNFANATAKFYTNSNDGKTQDGAGTNVTTGLTRATTNDIIMCACDGAGAKIWWGVNGTWLDYGSGTGDPAAGSNAAEWTTAMKAGIWFPVTVYSGTAAAGTLNLGNPAFSISSSQADDAGYGNFEYDVPAGFYALCTKNLAEYG